MQSFDLCFIIYKRTTSVFFSILIRHNINWILAALTDHEFSTLNNQQRDWHPII